METFSKGSVATVLAAISNSQPSASSLRSVDDGHSWGRARRLPGRLDQPFIVHGFWSTVSFELGPVPSYKAVMPDLGLFHI